MCAHYNALYDNFSFCTHWFFIYYQLWKSDTYMTVDHIRHSVRVITVIIWAILFILLKLTAAANTFQNKQLLL